MTCAESRFTGRSCCSTAVSLKVSHSSSTVSFLRECSWERTNKNHCDSPNKRNSGYIFQTKQSHEKMKHVKCYVHCSSQGAKPYARIYWPQGTRFLLIMCRGTGLKMPITLVLPLSSAMLKAVRPQQRNHDPAPKCNSETSHSKLDWNSKTHQLTTLSIPT